MIVERIDVGPWQPDRGSPVTRSTTSSPCQPQADSADVLVVEEPFPIRLPIAEITP